MLINEHTWEPIYLVQDIYLKEITKNVPKIYILKKRGGGRKTLFVIKGKKVKTSTYTKQWNSNGASMIIIT